MKRSMPIPHRTSDNVVDVVMGDGDLHSAHVPESQRLTESGILGQGPISYKATLQCNNPNLSFETRENPIWKELNIAEISEDDEPPEEDDLTCPTILLTVAEKQLLREPWRHALIIKMFDRGIGLLQLRRRLKAKWALKGDFSLIDIGPKEDACPHEKNTAQNGKDSQELEVPDQAKHLGTEDKTYGSWMLVRKPARRRSARQPLENGGDQGSRFCALATIDLNMEVETENPADIPVEDQTLITLVHQEPILEEEDYGKSSQACTRQLTLSKESNKVSTFHVSNFQQRPPHPETCSNPAYSNKALSKPTPLETHYTRPSWTSRDLMILGMGYGQAITWVLISVLNMAPF
ncbi:hypothetical protein Cgig2_008347 [Carnegiea gigantea]|uniref:Uncharacterized protein n=1 Tax=Carnegiea gigantea TaxID=171969 RepID=A0A9Q1QA40_9CARY|nr:hypothetical protein Cgig2_008347 [Carnegiea gigantea]